jgi:hypothetical protein
MPCRVRLRERITDARRELIRLTEERLGRDVIAFELVAQAEPEERLGHACDVSACAEAGEGGGERRTLARLQRPLAQCSDVQQLATLESPEGVVRPARSSRAAAARSCSAKKTPLTYASRAS